MARGASASAGEAASSAAVDFARCGDCGLVRRGRPRKEPWPVGYCHCGIAVASLPAEDLVRVLRCWPTDRRPLWRRALEAREREQGERAEMAG